MNKFPLIHSISTVGLIQHYNQDYLVHHERTDFTGDNGIGKSLLADLLQILFIADKSKIAFGTEGFKKADRQIHTIPYESNDAYFFINIEKATKQYLTLGVNIPSSSSSSIKVFRVLNNFYNEEQEKRKQFNERKKLSGHLIPEEKLLYHTDFLVDDTIPRIEDLIKHLRDSKQLYLSFYTTKTERKELYQFLFDKEVLPLNLSIDSHLTAFAKVIQAFSKANTLDTDKDSSLKNFLFENKKAEIEAEYKTNKQKLDELISRYNELVELTNTLKAKRLFLEDLDMKKEAYIKVEKLYFKDRYSIKKTEFSTKLENWKNEETSFNNLNEEILKLSDILPELEKKKKSANKEYYSYLKSLDSLGKYKEEKDQLDSKLTDLSKLKALNPPDVSREKDEMFDFENIGIEEIESKISELDQVLTKYRSIKEAKKQFDKQTEEHDVYKLELNEQKKRLEKIQQIFNYKEQDTLASQIIKEGKALNRSQETILLHLLLDVKWHLPELITEGIQYADRLEILSETNITEDEEAGGYWFRSGTINTFTKYSEEEQLFDDVNKMKAAFDKKAKGLEREILKITGYIKDVTNRHFQNIENHLPKKHFSWDSLLPDQRKIEEYKTAVDLVKNLDTLKTQLQKEINKKKEGLASLKSKIPIDFKDNDLEKIINEKSDLQVELNKKQLEEAKKHTEAAINLKTKKEQLEKLSFDPEKVEEEKQDLIKILDKLRSKIELRYPDFFDEFSESETASSNTENLSHEYSTKKSVYEIGYKDVIKSFPSINDDIEFREQISNETYSFSILERKLLGNTIAEIKNIEKALRSANEEKRKLSSTLRQTMLKIFQKTQNEYENYRSTITKLNTFFRSILISKTYFFQVVFEKNPHFSIQWINDLQSKSQHVGDKGELFESDSVENYVEEFFKEASGFRNGIAFSDLLDPKTYFTLSTDFKDEADVKNPGSTGQSYTARVLLGIGRLSIALKEKRNGLRFLILEEVSNLDKDNFNTFPQLAKEHGYQIITMTPEPFGSNSTDGWYLHQLIKGKDNKKINYTPNSSFKTNFNNEQLDAYLKRIKN